MYAAFVGYILGLLTRIKQQPHGKPDTGTPGQHSQSSPSLIGNYSPPPLTDEEKAEKKEDRRREKIKFRLQKWTLVVLAIYTGFTGFMWWETKEAADAAKKSADTARNALEISRANIVIDTFEATWGNEPNASVNIRCVIRNAGQTTALNIGISPYGGRDVPFERNVSDTPTPSDLGGISLAANDKRECGWIKEFRASDSGYIEQVRAGKAMLYFTIGVNYRDVFGKSWGLSDCLSYDFGSRRFDYCLRNIEPIQ